MARIAHLLDHSMHGDSRVFRAAQAQQKSGHDITIFALNRSSELMPSPDYGDIKVVQCLFDDNRVIPIFSKLSIFRKQIAKLRLPKGDEPNSIEIPTNNTSVAPIKPKVPVWKRALGLQFWHRTALRALQTHVSNFSPDLIHAHDLTMLPSGAQLAENLDAKLIYDSHEYERSRNMITPGISEHIRIGFEARYIKFADAVICVSDSIASQLTRDYGIVRPLVIPNTAEVGADNNFDRRQFKLPNSVKLAGYFGSLQPGRGLGIAIRAIAETKDWYLLIMGAATDERRSELSRLAKSVGVADRILIRKAVPKDQVCDVMSLCDVTLIPVQKTCLSYDYALPNKLFQSLHAGVPIVATPLTEISAFVQYFSAGLVAEGFEISDISRALEEDRPIQISHEADLAYYDDQQTLQNSQKIIEAVLTETPLPVIAPLPHYVQISRQLPQVPL